MYDDQFHSNPSNCRTTLQPSQPANINRQIRRSVQLLFSQKRPSKARGYGNTSSRTSWPRQSSILTDEHTFSVGERTKLSLDGSGGECITSVRRHPCVALGSAPEDHPAVVAQDDWWGTYISSHPSLEGNSQGVSLVPCNIVLCDLLVNLTHLRWQAKCLLTFTTLRHDCQNGSFS